MNPATALRDRFGALRNLPRVFRLVWSTSTGLTLATVGLRLLRAILPTAALYVGKLIIDAVAAETRVAVQRIWCLILATSPATSRSYSRRDFGVGQSMSEASVTDRWWELGLH